MKKRISNGRSTRLEIIDVSRWTKKDVLLWLKKIGMRKSLEKVFTKNNIDGKKIVEMDGSKLINLGVDDDLYDCSGPFLKEVDRLKKERFFSRKRYNIISKLSKFPGFNSSIKECADMISILCEIEEIKNRYLSLDDLKTYCLPKVTEGEEEEESTRTNSLKKKKARVNVKIVVNEMSNSSRTKSTSFRRFISPLASKSRSMTDFGSFRTDVIVGPWMMKWDDSEIVFPKKVMVSSKAIICVDVATLRVQEEELVDIRDKIADVVMKWNTEMEHQDLGGTCQDFVDSILRSIGVKTNFGKGDALGNFIQRMRKEGKCDLVFKPSKKFRKEFFLGMKKKKKKKIIYSFYSHSELDNFCESILKVIKKKQKQKQKQKKNSDDDDNNINQFDSEWSLLRSFDRAFWLRHFKSPDDPRYFPKEPRVLRPDDPFNTGCPFKDPREKEDDHEEEEEEEEEEEWIKVSKYEKILEGEEEEEERDDDEEEEEGWIKVVSKKLEKKKEIEPSLSSHPSETRSRSEMKISPAAITTTTTIRTEPKNGVTKLLPKGRPPPTPPRNILDRDNNNNIIMDISEEEVERRQKERRRRVEMLRNMKKRNNTNNNMIHF